MSIQNKISVQHKFNPSFKHSLIALAVMSVSTGTIAEEAPANAAEENIEVIEVTSSRGNLLSAQNLKRESATFVDSITAEDIGSLPDRSVLEAIQRLPGVFD